MIRELTGVDARDIFRIINESATTYKGHIPQDCYHEPYMPKEELKNEMLSMTFFGWLEKGRLVGVMALQPVKDVTLIRHAYILPDYQRSGIGRGLLGHIRRITKTRLLLVGTWADAEWAVKFYLKQGFNLMPDKDQLLRRYWDISQRQIETSVVLGIELN
jgi:GNAT superfamily N-acetyltransferase